jgi:phosphoglycerate kinase
MQIKSIRDVDLAGATILLRVDYNVPIIDGKIMDEYKVRQTMPTIDFLLKKRCKIVLISHFGRPEGQRDLKLSLKPLYEYLAEFYSKKNVKLQFVNDEVTEETVKKVNDSKAEIVMLENLRFSKGEENNSDAFVNLLAQMADIYVNDAFAVSHRNAASITGIAHELPALAGLNFLDEIKYLAKALKPAKPAVALLAGIKLETKLPVIKKFLPKYNYVLTGGAIGITLLDAKGYDIGGSRTEKDYLNRLKPLLKSGKLILPKDVIVADKSTKKKIRVVKIGKNKTICGADEEIFDIGPETIKFYADKIKSAKTIVWNGPLGLFEEKQFSHGTMALAKIIAARASGRAVGIAGGGETLSAIEKTHMAKYFDFLSTGGGAMLEFLAGKDLPGVKALMK